MLTNFSWQLLLSRPIRLWISESCRFWHKKKSLSSPLCAAKFTLPLSFATVGRVMPLFFLLIPLRLTLSVEWEELIIFSYTNPKRCEFKPNTPSANTYESWLLCVSRKGDRECRVWLKIQLRSVSVPASVSSTPDRSIERVLVRSWSRSDENLSLTKEDAASASASPCQASGLVEILGSPELPGKPKRIWSKI